MIAFQVHEELFAVVSPMMMGLIIGSTDPKIQVHKLIEGQWLLGNSD